MNGTSLKKETKKAVEKLKRKKKHEEFILLRVKINKLTLFLTKTNIFVHGKNCTFSKKGLGHKGRCYSVCIDDTCK